MLDEQEEYEIRTLYSAMTCRHMDGTRTAYTASQEVLCEDNRVLPYDDGPIILTGEAIYLDDIESEDSRMGWSEAEALTKLVAWQTRVLEDRKRDVADAAARLEVAKEALRKLVV